METYGLEEIGLRPGDRVQWSYLGKTGDTGTVLRVLPRHRRPQPGGVMAMVEVRWDQSGYVGRIEDRKLKRVAASGQS